jgi:hypothetical protein
LVPASFKEPSRIVKIRSTDVGIMEGSGHGLFTHFP